MRVYQCCLPVKVTRDIMKKVNFYFGYWLSPYSSSSNVAVAMCVFVQTTWSLFCWCTIHNWFYNWIFSNPPSWQLIHHMASSLRDYKVQCRRRNGEKKWHEWKNVMKFVSFRYNFFFSIHRKALPDTDIDFTPALVSNVNSSQFYQLLSWRIAMLSQMVRRSWNSPEIWYLQV